MFGTTPALVAGIGGLIEMVGHFTQNRNLLKIGGTAVGLGSTLSKMDGMLSAGKAGEASKKSGLGIQGSLTDTKTPLGAATDHLLGPAAKPLKGDSPLSAITNAHIGLPKDTTPGLTGWLDSDISDLFLK